jgi:Domain of unknown function (DUF4173)
MSEEAAAQVGRLSSDGRWRWDGTAWTPILPAEALRPPAWMSVRVRNQATWWAVAAALIAGLAADQTLRVGAIGLGASVTFGFAALLLVFAGRISRLEPRLLVAGAAVFGAWLSLRASPWLLVPDIAVSLALLAMAGSLAARGSLLDIGIAESVARGLNGALHGIAGGVFVGKPILKTRPRLAVIAPFARGLLIAIPIAAVLAALLASADPIFASFLNFNVDFGQLLLDAFFVLAGSLAMAGLLRLAAAEPMDRVDGPVWRLGTTEALVVLSVLDTVFAAFAIAQAMAASGTGADTLRAAGVTYSDYARSGYFQLLWVAGITLVVLILFSRITGFTHRTGKVAFIALAEVAIALTLLIVLVASLRLSLYEGAYGFTMLRLYSHVFAGLVAIVFLLLAADLAGLFQRRRWFVGVSTLTALGLLLALNVANPEAIVVGLNVDRANQTHKIDAQYFQELSSDAAPALLASQARIEPALRQDVKRVACAGPRSYAPSAVAFNWADAEAAQARRQAC